MRYPKDIEIWESAPGRRLAEVVIQVNNVKGAMADCSRVVSEPGVNMLTGFHAAPGTSTLARWSFFADVTDAKVELSELKERLRSVPTVVSVDVMASEDGFMVDKQHFPVQWSGRRAIIFRADALSEMLQRLWSVFGSGAGTIVDQMAETMGRHFANETVEDFGRDFAKAQLDELLMSYTALGYADVAIERSKTADFPVVVHTKKLFECEANAKKRLHRKSVFFRAHLRGFMSALFGEVFEVTEVQCLTEGDDVCSFGITVRDDPLEQVTIRPAERQTKGRI
ncbi:MAG: hypothetical protein HY297_01605 [Thaumarchaeota archaeon]|nr:hypothetical protein [Nitrososphaerota archaeon]